MAKNHQSTNQPASRPPPKGFANLARLLIAINAAFYATLVLSSKPSTTLTLTQAGGSDGEMLSRVLFAVMAVNAALLVMQCCSERMRNHHLAFLPMFILGLEFLLIAGVANDLNVTPVYVANVVLHGGAAIWGAIIQLDRR